MIRVQDDLLILLPLRVVETKDAGNILLEFVGVDGYRRRLTLDRAQLEATALAMQAVVGELAQSDKLRKRIETLENRRRLPAGSEQPPPTA